MNKAPFKLDVSSEIFDAFCKSLDDFGMDYSKFDVKGPRLVVNSSQDTIKELLFHIIEQKHFWNMLSAVIVAFIYRNKFKKITVWRNGMKVSSSGYDNTKELMKLIEDADKLEIKVEDDNKSPPDYR